MCVCMCKVTACAFNSLVSGTVNVTVVLLVGSPCGVHATLAITTGVCVFKEPIFIHLSKYVSQGLM